MQTNNSNTIQHSAAKFLLSVGPTTMKELKETGCFYPDYNDPAVRGTHVCRNSLALLAFNFFFLSYLLLPAISYFKLFFVPPFLLPLSPLFTLSIPSYHLSFVFFSFLLFFSFIFLLLFLILILILIITPHIPNSSSPCFVSSSFFSFYARYVSTGQGGAPMAQP